MHIVILSKYAPYISTYCILMHLIVNRFPILLIYMICTACYIFFIVVACISIIYSEYILPGKQFQSWVFEERIMCTLMYC